MAGVHHGEPTTEPPGRVARLRARAQQASDHYEELAQSRPLLGLPLSFLTRYAARQGMLMASAVAFRLFLWLMPLALLLAGITAAFSADTGSNVESAASTAGLTGAARQEVLTSLDEAHRSWWVAVVLGGVALLWTTRTLMQNLRLVHAHAWQVPVPKHGLKHIVATVFIFTGGALVVALVAVGIPRLDDLVPGGILLGVLLQGIATSAVWLLLSFRFPDRRRDWIDLIPGSLLVGYSLAVLNVASRIYLPHALSNSAELYGALGVSAVILGWLLLIGQVIVCGALTNSVWTDYRAGREGHPATIPTQSRTPA